MNNSGIIFLNKQKGITSFDALREVKRALGTGKVGHTGTLDKFAQGLLIVLAGRALRLSRWFTHCDKKYIGKIRFGEETDTLDPEGKIIAQAAPPSREDVESVLSQFSGAIMQAPPAFSAIHINGKRASDLSRGGKEIEMKKREVTIYKLELLSWEPPFAEIFVHCSSGTYIRSLARDIALAAESRAHLCELLRTQVAGFELGSRECGIRESGIRSEELGVRNSLLPTPINKTIINKIGMPWYEVSEKEAQDIFNGKPLSNSSLLIPNSSLFNNAAVFWNDELIAVIEKTDGKWKYGCVIRK